MFNSAEFKEMLKNPRVIGVKNSSMPTQDIQMWRDEGAIGGTYAAMPELYIGMHQEPQKADSIVGFGNFNDNIIRRAAELSHQGYAKRIQFTGGLSRNTQGLLPESEAARFTRVAVECGVPPEAVLQEDKSTNTKENVIFTRNMLTELGLPCNHILGVHKPVMERRICAALGIYWPQVKITVTSPQVSITEYLADAKRQGPTENAAVSVIVGDFQRMDLYARKGYQLPQQIPVQAWQACHQLVTMGYDKQLAK